jgi:hypothetical protein
VQGEQKKMTQRSPYRAGRRVRASSAHCFWNHDGSPAPAKSWKTLTESGAAASWLTAQVLAFAKAHPDDVPASKIFTSRPSRCEEGLHLQAVKPARHTKRTPRIPGRCFPTANGGYPRSAYGLGGAGVEAGFGVVEAGLVAAGLAGAAEALAG